jgi:biotin carboxyl carrier protein
MTHEIKLHVGSQTYSHKLELKPVEGSDESGGKLTFSLDGSEPQQADWIEIASGTYSIILGARSYEARVITAAAEPVSAGGSGGSYNVRVGSQENRIEIQDPRARRGAGTTGGHRGPQEVSAPMPGKIIKVLVSENQEVDAGQGLVVIEAMKMQNELRAPRPGLVEKIHVREGVTVETGFKLLTLV